jgi:hypothetical protein
VQFLRGEVLGLPLKNHTTSLKKVYRSKEPYHLSSFFMVLGHEERVAELGFTHFAFSSNINKSWAFLSHGEDVVKRISRMMYLMI